MQARHGHRLHHARSHEPRADGPVLLQDPARQEELDRIRRRGVQEKAAATAANLPHDFEAATQWRWSFSKLINDSEFWRVEVEEPAIRVLTKLESLDCVLGGDVQIARQHGFRSGTPRRPTWSS